MTTRFREVAANSGFDASSLMIPEGQSSDVRLLQAAGVTVISTSPQAVVTQTPAARGQSRVTIQCPSALPAPVRIEARRGSTVVAMLEAYTLPHIHIRVNFFAVQDNSRRTARPLAQARQIVIEMNEIFTPQTNIEFELGRATPYVVSGDLGAVVDGSWDPTFSQRRISGDFDVYFVWETEVSATIAAGARRLRDRADARTIQYDFCLLEDNITDSSGRIMAHEAGHFLMGAYHNPVRGYMMYMHTPVGGRISRFEAMNMNHNAMMRPGLPALPGSP